ncbi:MAG: ATP-dependent zinc metalloprotease FtsH [Candidatus Cloacimonetes bacterium]|nr:ATP-dependent zinc metalloprotease FtsH [Candidatus Cloacimonadota bacterium]
MNDNRQPNKPGRFSRFRKSQSITFWIVLLLFLVIVYHVYTSSQKEVQLVAFSEFIEMTDAGEVLYVDISEKDIRFRDRENNRFIAYIPYEDPALVRELIPKVGLLTSQKPSRLVALLVSWLPFLIFIGFWIFMLRSMQGGGNRAFSFGKSKAKLFVGGKTNKSFKDVAGVEEAKEELEEIIDFLKAPEKFQRLGGRIPRGVLLLGRPGTGKTLLAKAVAGEAGVPFFSISGSDFVEMFVGVGASRVRDLFEQAKRSAPCIAFIDEIDAVGRHRGSGIGGGHDEREQTLNQLLVEMDGFEANDSVIIIAATNRPDVLDPALLRPGRFDRQVIVDLPDIKGRDAILKVHVKGLPLGKNVKLGVIARGTPGFSGADLANLVNEAALLAARRDQKAIRMEDFEEAKDKVTMGKARRSKVISEEEKRITAYHEVGHVLCSIFQDKTEPVHKVTIIPRGFAGGATHYLLTDKTNYSRSYLEQTLIGLMGGRAAEEIVFEDLTTGAGSDIQRATDMAKKMVCNWGMSARIGPMTIGREEGQVFLGKEIGQRDHYSEETARIVDAEIRGFIEVAHSGSKEILAQRREVLEHMAERLLEVETLGTDEIFEIIFEHITDADREIVEKKHEKALELRLDTTHDDDADESDDARPDSAEAPPNDVSSNEDGAAESVEPESKDASEEPAGISEVPASNDSANEQAEEEPSWPEDEA